MQHPVHAVLAGLGRSI